MIDSLQFHRGRPWAKLPITFMQLENCYCSIFSARWMFGRIVVLRLSCLAVIVVGAVVDVVVVVAVVIRVAVVDLRRILCCLSCMYSFKHLYNVYRFSILWNLIFVSD